jgi:hypothetical protein
MAATYKEFKVPLSNMSFTPDVPSQALAPLEYNSGRNVETNVRGIQTVLGDELILSSVPAGEQPIFVTAGYRSNQVYWYIVATRNSSNHGRWYGITESGITNITPGVGGNPSAYIAGYVENISITDSWNGTYLFINDSVQAPMYLTPEDTEFSLYDAAPDNYVWNYNPDWNNLTAAFMRLYATPNVGSILIAGNLTADVISTGLTQNFPYTVRWSQAFGIDSGPISWDVTLATVANELEVPVRGPVVDGFPLNGNFYVMSYWDTVVFSPISYQTSTAPILGVRLFNQGRGLLNENCWAAADDVVFGVDARDIWVFNGNQFKAIGNQRVKDYFYSNLNALYQDRTFMVNNTNKYQIEIYYSDQDSTGWPNQMLSYRYDLDVWNPPRAVSAASHAAEGPRYELLPDSSMGFNEASRTVVYTRAVAASQLVQKDVGNEFLGGTAIDAEFRRDNITLGVPYSAQTLVHRVLPEVSGTGNIQVEIGGANSVGAPITFKTPVSMAIATEYPWVQINQNAFRVNSIRVSSNSTADDWTLTAVNWQFQQTEDAR